MCRDVTLYSELLGLGRNLPGKIYTLLTSIVKADVFQMRLVSSLPGHPLEEGMGP